MRRYTVILCLVGTGLVLPAAGPDGSAAGQAIITGCGEITDTRVAPLHGTAYHWSVHGSKDTASGPDPAPCHPDEAVFIGGIDDGPSVSIRWMKAGTYFIKTVALNPEGCPNIRYTVVQVVPEAMEVSVFPNPVTNDEVTFRVTLQRETHASILIQSTESGLIAPVFDGLITAGETRTVTWKSWLPQGVYAYRILTDREVRSGRLVMIRIY